MSTATMFQASEKDTEEADNKDSTDTSEAQFADMQEANTSWAIWPCWHVCKVNASNLHLIFMLLYSSVFWVCLLGPQLAESWGRHVTAKLIHVNSTGRNILLKIWKYEVECYPFSITQSSCEDMTSSNVEREQVFPVAASGIPIASEAEMSLPGMPDQSFAFDMSQGEIAPKSQEEQGEGEPFVEKPGLADHSSFSRTEGDQVSKFEVNGFARCWTADLDSFLDEVQENPQLFKKLMKHRRKISGFNEPSRFSQLWKALGFGNGREQTR